MKLNQAGFETLFRSGLIVFIDGECHLCHGLVQFILRHEAEPRAHFAAIQDFLPELSRLFPALAPELQSLQYVLVVDQGKPLVRSEAVLRIARSFRAPWSVLARLGLVVPAPLRDLIYVWIARNRYAWFGKKDQCAWNPAVSRERIIERL